MNYQEFCEYIKENIKEYLPERYQNREVKLKTTIKNNEVEKCGLMLDDPSQTLSPVLYLEGAFNLYKKGQSLDVICDYIADQYQEARMNPAIADIDFEKFDAIKDMILPIVVSAKENKNQLSNKPHQYLDDLVVMYQVEIDNTRDEVGTVAVNNKLMKIWNVSGEEIHQKALENQKEKYPAELCKMEELLFGNPENFLLNEDGKQPEPEGMYVLKTSRNVYGAAAIADKEIMEQVAQTFNDDYVILPSSIHECIILPQQALTNMGFTPKELGKMVREVNNNEVSKEERLSDHIYRYSKEDKVLEGVRESKNRNKEMER